FFIFAHTTALAFGWRSNDHQPNQRVNYFLPTNILLILIVLFILMNGTVKALYILIDMKS
ncbi:hypothetical protein ACTQ5K_21695, partial [Niallia sp. Sow4_A1]|uniref:hypothetical protein n=1 Tax=Niallia sp. Sow4_A1 TaxID=3438793 RepID=UPI003F9DCB6C